MRPFALLFTLALLLSAALVHAEPSAAEIAVARRLYREAVALEEQGKWAEAEARLREAIGIKETPGLRFHLAVAQEKQGKLVEALVDYDRAEEMIQRGSRAPDVEQLLGPAREAVKRRIPTLTVSAPEDARETTLSIDGKTFNRALLGKPIPLNPGPHRVAVTAAGKRPFQVEVVLTESEEDLIEATFEGEGAAPTAGAPGWGPSDGSSTTAGADEAPTSSSTRTAVLIGGAAFTVVALGAGIGFTLYRADRQQEVDEAQGEIGSDEDACNTSTDQGVLDACAALGPLVDQRDNAKTFQVISFVAAGVGAVATVATYFLWKPETSAPTARVDVAPIRGGAVLGVSGAF